MALKCGIVGLPNVGKSTLFNSLSNAEEQAANFPFCTIEPNIGTITVPDERLNQLEAIAKPQQVLPATIEIVDIAGLVKGASKGEGLGNQFLSNIRNTDAILHVLRCFDNDNIIHVDGSVDPVRDKEIIDIELQLKDLESIETKIGKVARAAKSGDKEASKCLEVLEIYKAHLEAGESARSAVLGSEKDKLFVDDLQLLTMKPVLYVCNVDEDSVVNGNEYVTRVKEVVAKEGASILLISAAIESDISQLDTYEDRQMFLEELGLKESGVTKLIQSAYELLNYITYFTVGEKEVRAWTFKAGDKAPQAAGVIHTDFERGFIKAEIYHCDDLFELESEQKVKVAGKLRIEGKEYVVKDGDIIHFRFNV